MVGMFIKRTALICDQCEYNAMLQMFCIGFTDSLTMSVPLQVLKLLAADFDGRIVAA